MRSINFTIPSHEGHPFIRHDSKEVSGSIDARRWGARQGPEYD